MQDIAAVCVRVEGFHFRGARGSAERAVFRADAVVIANARFFFILFHYLQVDVNRMLLLFYLVHSNVVYIDDRGFPSNHACHVLYSTASSVNTGATTPTESRGGVVVVQYKGPR